jgi:hypothetical protein
MALSLALGKSVELSQTIVRDWVSDFLLLRRALNSADIAQVELSKVRMMVGNTCGIVMAPGSSQADSAHACCDPSGSH